VAQGAVGGQDGVDVAAGEVDRAAVVRVRVVEQVLRRDREVEGNPDEGAGRGADGVVGGGRGADRDGVAGAVDGAVGRVDGRGRVGWLRGRARGGAEGAGVGSVRAVGGGGGAGVVVALGEVDRAGVARVGVVELVLRRYREVERAPRRGGAGGADHEVRRRRGA